MRAENEIEESVASSTALPNSRVTTGSLVGGVGLGGLLEWFPAKSLDVPNAYVLSVRENDEERSSAAERGGCCAIIQEQRKGG